MNYMPKKAYAMAGLLISLALILGSISFACYPIKFLASIAPPAPPDPGMPDNYTTYTDPSGIFRISYPADWEGNADDDLCAIRSLNRLQSGLPIQDNRCSIFTAFKFVKYRPVASVDIRLRQVYFRGPSYSYSIDEEAKKAGTGCPDFKELSRIQTTIDGKEATIWGWEGTFTAAGEKTPLYHLELYLPTNQAIWVVDCEEWAGNSTQWENDFDTIVRSLRISY